MSRPAVVKLSYTWTSSRTGQQAFSTLDRIMYTSNLELESKTADWSVSVSDHAAVIAHFRKSMEDGRKSTMVSRLDPRLLLDNEGKEQLNMDFRNLFSQRSPDWNPHVSLEYCKMCIRTAANSASGVLKARYRDDEVTLNKDINDVIDELSDDNTPADRKTLLTHKLDDLRMLKRRLVEKIGARLERRTARQWYNEGELSNKYFFNLYNRKANDEINVIVSDTGELINDPSRIEAGIRGFYKDLYESVPEDIEINDEFFRNITPASPEIAADVVKMLTLAELENTLKMCTDSSPGPDGIPYSYLKHFWSDFGPILLDAWNHSLNIGELPPSHKISYLRLIPKVGKDPRLISNLRPITLSNTDHKIITKTYARKLTELIAPNISGEQTAYVPGRLINDNLRAMMMSIDLANEDPNVDGVVVSLDAKKAFDSVDHRYIRKCLEAFGLAPLVPIFNTLYKDLKSDIIINGKTVDGYKILKGVKQGDALSCIIFIMCIEPLLRNLSENRSIERIETPLLPILLPKTYGYADDVTVITKKTDQGIQAIFNEYESFTNVSGLVLNAEKTEILCFNRDRNSNQNFNITYRGNQHQLNAATSIKVNGIFLLQDSDRREDINVQKVLDAMERQFQTWSRRHLTLLGKILVIKTFIMSQSIFLIQSISLKPTNIKKLMMPIYKFLWNKNLNAARAPERIKRSIMLTPCKYGGFGLVDLKDIADSLDLKAYGRLRETTHPFFRQIKDLINSANFFNVELNHKVDIKLEKALKTLNSDRRSILNWT